MNINAVSASAPKIQTTKAARSVNFTGLEKAAQSAGSAAGEAAAAAINKAGITDKVVKVLSMAIEGLKNLGQKVLRSFKKLIFGPHDINIGKNSINYVVNGKKVTAEEFNDAVSAFGASSDAAVKQKVAKQGVGTPNVVIKQTVSTQGAGISHISQKTASGEKISITKINGKTYINGKPYTPGDVLPEGVTFKDGAFYIDKGNGKKTTITQTTEEI